MKHDHLTHRCNCAHEAVRFCRHCNVCYCLSCKQEWSPKSDWHFSYPHYTNPQRYVNTQPWEITYGGQLGSANISAGSLSQTIGLAPTQCKHEA